MTDDTDSNYLMIPGGVPVNSDNPVPQSPQSNVLWARSPDQIFDKGMIFAESGGRQFDSFGRTLLSPAGAEGVAQVTLKTGPEAAKYAGLEWDPERLANDADYNKQLGKAYFNHQLDYYGGDASKAVAAYNAGPGRVDQAIKQAEANGGSFTQYLPQETQNYIKKVLGSSTGAGVSSTLPTGEAGAIPQNAASLQQSTHGLAALAALQAMAPNHKFTPVNYDPFKIAKGAENPINEPPTVQPYQFQPLRGGQFNVP